MYYVYHQLTSSVGIWLFNVWAEDVKRRRWRLYYIFCLEMKRFRVKRKNEKIESINDRRRWWVGPACFQM